MLPQFLVFVQEHVTWWLLLGFCSSLRSGAALICRTITTTLPSTSNHWSKLYSEKGGKSVCLEEWETAFKANRILTARSFTASFVVLNIVRNLGECFALNTSRNKMCLQTDEQYCWPNTLCWVHKVWKGKKCLFFLMSFNWVFLLTIAGTHQFQKRLLMVALKQLNKTLAVTPRKTILILF